MPPRPTWKGFLKVSLVNIPVKVFPATESAAAISFNQLHAECQTRIQQKRWCPHCDREVPNSELVKGYEFEKGRYVIVGDEDIEKVRVESTRVINLVQFADDSDIDPIYVDRAYYLAPDGPVAADAFAVMREGMAGKAGIGKMALYGREYLVAVRPQKKGLVMYTLHHDAEIRSIDQIEELNSVPAKVVDLMDALRSSLDSVSTTKKKPAKADLVEVKGRRSEVKGTAKGKGQGQGQRANGIKKVASR